MSKSISEWFLNCTSRSFPHSWLITGFVTRLTRRVPLVEHKLLTLQENLNSLQGFSGICVARSLVLCVCFVDRCLLFVFVLSVIVLSVLLWFTESDYPFGIFKLFVHNHIISLSNDVWGHQTFSLIIFYWSDTRVSSHVYVCWKYQLCICLYHFPIGVWNYSEAIA